MIYVRIRSWHLWDQRAVSRAGRPYKTLCGRHPRQGAAELPDMPANEKTCERCLQMDRA